MEPENHPFAEENHLNQTFITMESAGSNKNPLLHQVDDGPRGATRRAAESPSGAGGREGGEGGTGGALAVTKSPKCA